MGSVVHSFENVNTKYVSRGTADAIKFLRSQTYRVDEILASQILMGSDEKAADYMALLGCSSIVPQALVVSLTALADFYQVEEEYMLRVLERRDFGVRKTPDLLKRQTVSEMLLSNGVNSLFGIHTPPQPGGMYELYDKRAVGLHKSYRTISSFRHSQNGFFLAARLALALSVMMPYGSRIPKDAKARAVQASLMKSSYYNLALDQYQANVQQFEEIRHTNKLEQEDVRVQNNSEQTVRATQDGDVFFSAEVFAKMISTSIETSIAKTAVEIIPAAVSASISETMKELRKSGIIPNVSAENSESEVQLKIQQKAWSRSKLKKPENWDSVMRRYRSGKLTLKEAATEVGMSECSFRRYANKGGIFAV